MIQKLLTRHFYNIKLNHLFFFLAYRAPANIKSDETSSRYGCLQVIFFNWAPHVFRLFQKRGP